MGFLGDDQPLYFVGYEMAKVIAEKHGPARLGELALGTGCGFIQAYISAVGDGEARVKLGEPTRRMVAEHCPPAV
jgi:hypothetical protein